MGKILSPSFYLSPTLEVSRALLGKRLVRVEADGTRTSGLIVETEGYVGMEDLGCHARSGKTARNASMWGRGGLAYVYFTYGMHWMLNAVTEREGFPSAVLIRAVVPEEGIALMRARRGGLKDKILADGPAKLTQAFAIGKNLDGIDLCDPASPLFIEEGAAVLSKNISTHPRVGLFSVPEPWKSIPWNFKIRHVEVKR
ncbi:DNA-3-methyladenine glycosylase [bacterium]|nr:MAG: DNA-3-methyladenine glycosylase [bacterium]